MSFSALRSVDYTTLLVTAAAARTVSTPVREATWTGVVAGGEDATGVVAISKRYPLCIMGEVELPVAGTPAVGALVYITSGNVLTTVSTGNTLFGKITALTDNPYNDVSTATAWIELLQAGQ